MQIGLIAYSKGTLSARLALKSLVETVDDMPAPQRRRRTLRDAAGGLVPTFPKARYWLNRGEVEHGRAPNEREQNGDGDDAGRGVACHGADATGARSVRV